MIFIFPSEFVSVVLQNKFTLRHLVDVLTVVPKYLLCGVDQNPPLVSDASLPASHNLG
jgi:hypothetical protein